MSKTSGYRIDPNNQELWKKFGEWTGGNQDAARLIFQLYQLAREADDIVDEKDCSQERVMALVELALIHVPGNPFYRQFQPQLSCIMMEVLAYWKVGDDFRLSEDAGKHIYGFVHRNSVDRAVVAIASLIGGSVHAAKVANELFDISHAQTTETVEEWLGD